MRLTDADIAQMWKARAEAAEAERDEALTGQFRARAEAVYWYGARHCPSRSAGATCVLEPGHIGPHEGNATDQIIGPKYRLWTDEDAI